MKRINSYLLESIYGNLGITDSINTDINRKWVERYNESLKALETMKKDTSFRKCYAVLKNSNAIEINGSSIYVLFDVQYNLFNDDGMFDISPDCKIIFKNDSPWNQCAMYANNWYRDISLNFLKQCGQFGILVFSAGEFSNVHSDVSIDYLKNVQINQKATVKFGDVSKLKDIQVSISGCEPETYINVCKTLDNSKHNIKSLADGISYKVVTPEYAEMLFNIMAKNKLGFDNTFALRGMPLISMPFLVDALPDMKKLNFRKYDYKICCNYNSRDGIGNLETLKTIPVNGCVFLTTISAQYHNSLMTDIQNLLGDGFKISDTYRVSNTISVYRVK